MEIGGIIAVLIPGILALTSFILGLSRTRLMYGETLIGLGFNIIFLLLTYRTKVFIINIYLISVLVWILLTPYMAKLKYSFTAAVSLLIFLSLYIPYYKLPIPLVGLLYYPFYFLGYAANNLKIVRDMRIKFYLLLGIIMPSLVLFFIFDKSLNVKNYSGLIFIQSLYGLKNLFVYSPIIVLLFLILGFSILLLGIDKLTLVITEGKHSINLRAAVFSSSFILPFLLLTHVLSMGQFVRQYLRISFSMIGIALYMVLKMRTDAISFAHGQEFMSDSFDIKSLYSKLFFILSFIFFMVASIEYILRGGNMRLTLDYIATASFAYNFIFVAFIYMVVISLVGIKLGSVFIFLAHCFIITGNYIKLKFLNEPFYFWDTYLIKNMLIISGGYIKSSMIMIIILLSIAIILLILKNLRTVLRELKPVFSYRLIILAVPPLMFNVYLVNHDKLKDINIGKDWYDGIDEFLRNGTYVESYLYLKDINKYLSKKPKDYSEERIIQVENQVSTEENTSNINPNVIVILSETFWDLNNLKNIRINKEVSNNLNKYRSGTIISPSFGWETANVEFEVLTGLSNFYFNKGIIPYNIYLNRNVPSIVSAFNDNGYDTVAIHPNLGSMYNRTKVYKNLGFRDFMDISNFDINNDIKGCFVADDKVIDKILTTLKEGEKSKLIFAVTIQNHDPYDRANKAYCKRELEVSSDRLTELETDILSNYAQGIYDADKSLGRLIDEVNKLEKPTLIYYFGDHLPRLGLPEGIFDIYKKLDYTAKDLKPENDLRFYETPLIVWSNYKKMNKINTPISPNQLSIEILRDAEIRYPVYFNYLLKLREKYPYLNKYLSPKDTIMNDTVINDYYLIQYDIMFGKNRCGTWHQPVITHSFLSCGELLLLQRYPLHYYLPFLNSKRQRG